MTNTTDDLRKVTFRKSGKAHRGIVTPRLNGRGTCLTATCKCPGSQNGKLTNGAAVIYEGWEKSNCGG